jgi:GGDEF domain-containing protein
MPRDFADVANVFRAQSRKSDVVGHINENRLAILAPDTDAQGARLLVRRLQRELDRAAANLAIDGPIRLRAGYSAVPNLAAAKVEVEQLMERAESALERVPRGVRAEPVLNFDDLPNS